VLGKAVVVQYKSNVRSIEQPFDTSRGATMSTATITRPTPKTPRLSPEVRRPAQPGSFRGPAARPVRTVPAPDLPTGRSADVRSCRVEVTGAPGEWRLTERGIALVLVLAVMITVAAVAVIGLTAWRVTGADYTTWSTETVRPR
jgi:hypothetical protein